MDRTDQPEFLNAVALIETTDSAQAIASKLKTIEQDLKKSPPFRSGPRTIDLDLLLYGSIVIDAPGLIIPHPRMHARRFVLEPLMELIDPETEHPVLHTFWQELLEQTKSQTCERATIFLS